VATSGQIFRRSVVLATVVLWALLSVTAARADTGDILEPQQSPPHAFDGFQVASCTSDVAPTCSPSDFGLFFRQAGGHPPVDLIAFLIKHTVIQEGLVEPVLEPFGLREPRTVKVDLPPGLTVNPEATAEKCRLSDFDLQQCPPGAKIGEVQLNLVTRIAGFQGLPKGGFFLRGEPFLGLVDLFNLEPRFGEPALLGFRAATGPVLLKPEVAWESDFHQSVRIEGLPDLEDPEKSIFPLVIHSVRALIAGRSGNGTALTLPTTCFDQSRAPFRHLYSSWVRMDSQDAPDPAFPFNSTPFEAALAPGLRPQGCENIPFDPSIEVNPGTEAVDSAATPTVTTRLRVEVPAGGGSQIAESHLRRAEVTLPEGMGLNPAGSAGVVACPDAQFHKGDRELTTECPDRSVVGSAELRTPLLSQPLTGNVFLGEPKSTDPASGEQFRLLVEAGNFERGVIVRLVGNVKADPRTGRLTAVFDDQMVGQFSGAMPRGLPQVPLESLTLRFGSTDRVLVRPLLTSPPTCSLATTVAQMEPWARPGTQTSALSTFTPSAFPGGGSCPQTLAQRPFAPLYTAKSDNAAAGSTSPFRIRILRPEGHQELKGIDLALPKGLIGKLAGIPYCPEAAIAAAQRKSAAAELGSPSCSAQSQVGNVATESGAGDEPLRLAGKAYLAGPYKGAPLSVVAITPARSGPFDLGVVVIRVALQLDPTTAQISAVSDVLPDVFGGVKLSLRTIDLDLDRPGFIRNPTSCAPQAVTGSIRGGGGDPANPAAFGSAALNAPVRVSGCESLGFAPKLTTTISGPTKRGKYPALSATLATRDGDANISRVAIALPRAFFVAQEHIATVCSKAQLASHSCPASSAYGQAEASTPLLDGKLSGPVYLVPGGGKLPDLVADLRGQVDIQLRGKIGTAKSGGIEAVFDSVPDVPVSSFSLQMAGGKKSLLVNSTGKCKAKRFAALEMNAHNGKTLSEKKYKLRVTGCKKKKGKKGKHRKKRGK
jgi:hypothetical protein